MKTKYPITHKEIIVLRLFIIILLLQNTNALFAKKWSDSGAYNISWYNKEQTNFTISTPEELAGVAYLVNNNFASFSKQVLHLTNDINLQGRDWIPIGTNNTLFEGTFKGNGFSITNVTLKDGDNYYCGFWNKLKDAHIHDLRIQSNISTAKSYAGALTPQANNTDFRNVETEVNITFLKKSISYGSTGTFFTYYIGGAIGHSTNCKYFNLKTKTDIDFEFGASNGNNCYGYITLYTGGIVGYGDNNTFEKCQAHNDFKIGINGYVTDRSYTITKTTTVYCGGIIGYDNSSKTTITACYSQTKSFKGYHYNGTYDTVSFEYGGIIGYIYDYSVATKLRNCVSITSSYTVIGHPYSWVASWYHTNSAFGGISCRTPKTFGGCYSNNDVVRDITKVRGDTQKENGSTSFSSTQMNSQDFVNELNIYSQLEFNTINWGLDENGKLILLYANAPDAIEKIKTTPDYTTPEIYDLNGIKHNRKRRGINIIRYTNGKTQKIIEK